MNWSKLPDFNMEGCEEAAQLFKNGCLTLNINMTLLDGFFEILSACVPQDAYRDITSVPSIEGVLTVLENVQRLCPFEEYLQVFAVITSASIPAKTKQNDDIYIIKSNSTAFAVLTLLDIMAASSKIGAGDEESIAIVSGSRGLVDVLFQEVTIVRLIKTMNLIYKKQDEIRYSLMAPLMFAHALLLSETKIQKFPNSIDDFREIQQTWFGDCLTEASLQARRAYDDLFRSAQYQENPWLEEEISDEVQSLLFTVREEAIGTIRKRVQMTDDFGYSELRSHYNVALRWLYPSFIIEHHSMRLSPRISSFLSFDSVADSLGRLTPCTDRELNTPQGRCSSSPALFFLGRNASFSRDDSYDRDSPDSKLGG